MAKLWTDWITPLRTTKVPKMASRKAAITSPWFQVLSIPRRSWIWEEWM